jgi:hypothetical protein
LSKLIQFRDHPIKTLKQIGGVADIYPVMLHDVPDALVDLSFRNHMQWILGRAGVSQRHKH